MNTHAKREAAHKRRVAPFYKEAKFRQHMSAIKLPEGFSSKFEVNTSWYVSFIVWKEEYARIRFDNHGGGHVNFNTAKGWRTFDRTGIEDSFYWLPLYAGDDDRGITVAGCEVILAEQLDRIEKRLDYFRSAIAIPGIPFTVAPDGVADLKHRLAREGFLIFMPSGFGTGYTVATTKRRAEGNRASAELEAFLGWTPLYVSTFDAD